MLGRTDDSFVVPLPRPNPLPEVTALRKAQLDQHRLSQCDTFGHVRTELRNDRSYPLRGVIAWPLHGSGDDTVGLRHRRVVEVRRVLQEGMPFSVKAARILL